MGGEVTSRIVIRRVSLVRLLRALLVGNISSFIYLVCFLSAGSIQVVSVQATDEPPWLGCDSGPFGQKTDKKSFGEELGWTLETLLVHRPMR